MHSSTLICGRARADEVVGQFAQQRLAPVYVDRQRTPRPQQAGERAKARGGVGCVVDDLVR